MRLGEPQGLSVLRLFDSALWQTSPHLQRQELLPWLRLNLTLKGAEEQQWGWHSCGDGCCQGQSCRAVVTEGKGDKREMEGVRHKELGPREGQKVAKVLLSE